ncbi:MAG: alpha/beta fold hydrolase [Solirubrobacteraceae bacterium]
MAIQAGPEVNRFVSWDGVEIAYREWGQPSALAPVVLHHGFVADANANWVAPGVVELLRAAGRYVVAPDARGHGSSQKPHDPARYGESRMARDLEVLVARLGAPCIDLVGHSMGAVVSLLYASRGEGVRRLVVGGVGSGVVECGGVDRRIVSNESIKQALAAQPDQLETLDPAGAAFRRLADALGADRQALLAQASSIHRDGVALQRITAPTLLLAGRSDPLASNPEVLAAAIPDARLTMLEGDHMSVVAEPAFAASIVEFLSA